MSFKDKILKKEFVITGEIGPPKGTDVKEVLEHIKILKGNVDAVNITDLQSSVMRLGAIAVSRIVMDNGMEPLCQFTTRDRNRLSLQSELMSAYVLGIRNVVVMTGDHPVIGDHPQTKPVYDLDSVTLLQTIGKLNSGQDLQGNQLKGATDLFYGAVVNPGADPLEPELIKMDKKISAGAQFFQTQAVFDTDAFLSFMDSIKLKNVPILAGIVLLKSAGMARYMNKNIPGVDVPENIIQKMETASVKKKASVEIAVDTIKKIREHVQGIHLMPIGLDDLVPEIVAKVK